MKHVQTAVLLLALMVSSSMSMHLLNQSQIVNSDEVCNSHTCGVNARCSVSSNGFALCTCLELHRGDPFVACEKVECSKHDDCSNSQICKNNRCVNPCSKACGVNANCTVINHTATCYCPPDHTGNPFVHCYTRDPEDPCKKPNICGPNTNCKEINGNAGCSCLPGFVGLMGSEIGCRRPECTISSECSAHHHCHHYRCEDPCQDACGSGANCEVVNHVPVCTCPEGSLGNPSTSCQLGGQFTKQSKIPVEETSLLPSKVVNPCDGACGTHADCKLQGSTPVCTCPKDRTGDPFVECRLSENNDVCHLKNPCGKNAICTPVTSLHVSSISEIGAVCTCPEGYFGDPFKFCKRDECAHNHDCPDNEACINSTCSNVCTGICGTNAVCKSTKHVAICVCNENYTGNPFVICNPLQSMDIVV